MRPQLRDWCARPGGPEAGGREVAEQEGRRL